MSSNKNKSLGVPLRVGLSGSTLRSGPEDGTSPTIPHAKERPIIFSGPMVRAILEGRKTQTRRIVKPQPDENGLSFMPNAPLDWRDDVHGDWNPWKGETPDGDTWRGRVQCWPGDRLWVRETWQEVDWPPTGPRIVYRANNDADPAKWRPSIFMPRAMSRITLEVLSVRVELLQDISEEDASAEGAGWETTGDSLRAQDNLVRMTGRTDPASNTSTRRAHFGLLWESINGPGRWDANPWVWVVEFTPLPR